MPRKVVAKELCALNGCDEEGVKSLAKSKIEDVFGKDSFKLSGKRAKLCKKHYKEYKKETKDDRKMDRLDW